MNEEQFRKLLTEQSAQLRKDVNEQLAAQEERLGKRINQEFVTMAGQLARHFDKRFDSFEATVTKRIHELQIAIDSIAKRHLKDSEEQAVINHGHERWFKQLAKNTHTKLVPEP